MSGFRRRLATDLRPVWRAVGRLLGRVGDEVLRSRDAPPEQGYGDGVPRPDDRGRDAVERGARRSDLPTQLDEWARGLGDDRSRE